MLFVFFLPNTFSKSIYLFVSTSNIILVLKFNVLTIILCKLQDLVKSRIYVNCDL